MPEVPSGPDVGGGRTEPPAAIVLDDLWVHAGQTPLVQGVSLRVGHGESVALLGHSGSGKSLTAAAITGGLSRLLDATGNLVLAGTPAEVDSSVRPPGLVASVQQDSSSALNPLLRVGKQLGVPLQTARTGWCRHRRAGRGAARRVRHRGPVAGAAVLSRRAVGWATTAGMHRARSGLPGAGHGGR